MIDMGNVMSLLQRSTLAAYGLDGCDLDDSVEIKNDKAAIRTEKAQVSRQLLELADTIALAEQLVRNEYWILKGVGYDITLEAMND